MKRQNFHLRCPLIAIAMGVALPFPSQAQTQPNAGRIKIVDVSTQAPVECTVLWCRADLSWIGIGVTKGGEIDCPSDTANGLYFHLAPLAQFTFYPDTKKCDEALGQTISLKRMTQPKIAALQGAIDLQNKPPLENSLRYQEMMIEAERAGIPEVASQYSLTSNILLGQVIGVKAPIRFADNGREFLASAEFTTKIKELQSGLDLPSTGKLDIRTVARAKAVLDSTNNPAHLQDAVIPTGAERLKR